VQRWALRKKDFPSDEGSIMGAENRDILLGLMVKQIPRIFV